MAKTEPNNVLIAGEWRQSQHSGTFQAMNPTTREPLSEHFPVSTWSDCDAALNAASDAYEAIKSMETNAIASFLRVLADEFDSIAGPLSETAAQETALPLSPRLRDVELPRTTGQLRQAAEAVDSESWRMATIDTANNIRSCYGSVGPVCVFGPNNFPFAFGSVSGGDFAAALAAGNPVIGKANTSHPKTTQLFAEAALTAVKKSKMPQATIQLLYRLSHQDGERLVADSRVAATAYTGSRHGGLKLKQAADAAGNMIYLELSANNPIVILPGALSERGEEIAKEFAGSCLMGTGQFCTNPGLIVLLKGESTDAFIATVSKQFADSPSGTLLSAGVEESLIQNVQSLTRLGANLLTGGTRNEDSNGCSVSNTLLQTTATKFLSDPVPFQTEMFGNASLLVVAEDLDEVVQVLESLEGNLTGCVYSHTGTEDDAGYKKIEPSLRKSVGRLLNDKMPTGVAVSAAMNHGGPYPATGHPHFTAVGIPASISRFAALQCYDNVREARLPACLKDENSTGAWRSIDGTWCR